MKLEIFDKLEKGNSKIDIKGFLKELSQYFDNLKNNKEDGLYYVLDGNPEKVYLTKFNSKKVLEKSDLPKDIMNSVSEGFILRCKEGKYTIDEKLTEKNFDGKLKFK